LVAYSIAALQGDRLVNCVAGAPTVLPWRGNNKKKTLVSEKSKSATPPPFFLALERREKNKNRNPALGIGILSFSG